MILTKKELLDLIEDVPDNALVLVYFENPKFSRGIWMISKGESNIDEYGVWLQLEEQKATVGVSPEITF